MSDADDDVRMPDRHVGADALADLQEGLLDADGEAAARRHLELCPACRDDLAVLTAVPSALASAGSVGPAPDDVAARLDAALAAEGARPAAVSGGAQTVTPLRAAKPSGPRGIRVLQVAAVVVVLLGLGGLAVSGLRGGGFASSGGSAGTASDAGGVSAPEAAKDGSYPVSASGRDWTAASLAQGVPGLLAGTAGPTVPTATSDNGSGSGSRGPVAGDRALADVPAGRLAGGPPLAACLTALGGATTPLAVDLASFQGRAAAVIVLPDQTEPTRVEVWVVEPTCSPADAGVLYYASVPRS